MRKLDAGRAWAVAHMQAKARSARHGRAVGVRQEATPQEASIVIFMDMLYASSVTFGEREVRAVLRCNSRDQTAYPCPYRQPLSVSAALNPYRLTHGADRSVTQCHPVEFSNCHY